MNGPQNKTSIVKNSRVTFVTKIRQFLCPTFNFRLVSRLKDYWDPLVGQIHSYRIFWPLQAMSMFRCQHLCSWKIYCFAVSYRYRQLTGHKYKVSWHTQQRKYNQIDKNPYCVQFIDFHLCSFRQSCKSQVFCKIGLKINDLGIKTPCEAWFFTTT